MPAHQFVATGHISYVVSIDTDDERWAYLLDSPREDWPELLSQDEDVHKQWQKDLEAHRSPLDGWLEVDEHTRDMVDVVPDL